MASICKLPNGRKALQFTGPDGTRKTLRLGRLHMTTARLVKSHVEAILSARAAGMPVPHEQATWLRGVGDVLHDRMARCGLVDRREVSLSLGEWVTKYLTTLSVKGSTREQIEIAAGNLVAFLGAETSLDQITPHDGDRYRHHLESDLRLATATARRRIGRAKQILSAAVRDKRLDANPWSHLVSAVGSNPSRMAFIDADVILKVIREAPPGDWRTIIALARFGGLRMPSELVGLRWSDVSFGEGFIRVTSPKTEHHAGQGERFVPLFADLRPWLVEAFERAPDGSEFVIEAKRYRSPRANLRTEFERLLRRSGVKPWERLFQNLRASRETELLGAFPAKDVAGWLGNSVPIAMKHYATARENVFTSAVDFEATQNPTQNDAESGGTASQATSANP